MSIYINEEADEAISSKALDEETILEYGSRYKDATGNRYQLTRHWSEVLNKELCILYQLPQKEILELMTLAFSAITIEKAAAICIEIGDREFDYSKKNRLLFIGELERDYLRNKENGFRIKLCIGETRLFDPTNRDPVVGKSFHEINQDAAFYRAIADRAKRILDNIDFG